MFLKKLEVYSQSFGMIRDIAFHKGVNLISFLKTVPG